MHVDVDVRGDMCGDLGDAVGPGAMVGARQDCFAAESFHRRLDALVIGGNDDPRREGGLPDLLNDVLNHRFAGD